MTVGVTRAMHVAGCSLQHVAETLACSRSVTGGGSGACSCFTPSLIKIMYQVLCMACQRGWLAAYLLLPSNASRSWNLPQRWQKRDCCPCSSTDPAVACAWHTACAGAEGLVRPCGDVCRCTSHACTSHAHMCQLLTVDGRPEGCASSLQVA